MEFSNSNDYIKYTNMCMPSIENISNGKTKALLKLMMDKKTYEQSIKPIWLPDNKKMKRDNALMFLFSYKLSLLCSNAKSNSFYSKLFNKQPLRDIEKSYVPGIDQKEILLDQSIESIEEVYQEKCDGSTGTYLCSCSSYFVIPPCGFPTEIGIC